MRLRAFTPLEQKAVKAAATTFRTNPDIDTEQAIMQLGIGEALVSTLDEKGQPTHGRADAGAAAELARRSDHRGRAQGRHRRRARCEGEYDETEDRDVGL